MKADKPRINLVALATALILFVFPWIDVQCGGKTMATQSGLQVVYGGASLTEDAKGLDGDQSQSDGVGMGLLTLLALLLIIAGIAFPAIKAKVPLPPRIEVGHIAAAALVLLLLQGLVGFPIESSGPDAGGPEKRGSPPGQLDREVGRAMQSAMRVEYEKTTWFYLELLALAVPVGLIGYEYDETRRRRAEAAAPTVTGPQA